MSGSTETGTMTITGTQSTGAQSPRSEMIVTGSLVTLDYTLRVSSGWQDIVFDTSRESDSKDLMGGVQSGRTFQPISFVAGGWQMIAGFDLAVRGMKIGDAKVFSLEPIYAYGWKYEGRWVSKKEFDKTVVQEIPRFRQEEVPVSSWTWNGKPVPKVGEALFDGSMTGNVISVSNTSVTVNIDTEWEFKTIFGTGFTKVWDTTTANGIKVKLISTDARGWTVEFDNSLNSLAGKEISEGTEGTIGDTSGGTMKYKIEKIEGDRVYVVFPDKPNTAPLADKTLKFDVKIVNIQ